MGGKAQANKHREWASRGLIALLLLTEAKCEAQAVVDSLRQSFENPPLAARPRVWWHWMNGNITKDGIKLDLEWMQRSGIGGFQTFDAGFLTPKVVDKPLEYMTPDWKDAFRYATHLADTMHMEEGIAGSPGWSETGGPWVPASEGMKKYVWSELRVHGGTRFQGVVPHPPSVTGEFQSLAAVPGLLSAGFKAPEYYADSAVLAYKVPASEAELHPVVTSSSVIDLPLLRDGDLTKYTTLPMPKQIGEKAWVQYFFPQPETIRAITILAGKKSALDTSSYFAASNGIAFESSDDGQTFSFICDIPKGGNPVHTASFPAVTAKYFRVTFRTQVPPTDALVEAGFAAASKPPTSVALAEITLHTGARVNRFEDKAAFAPLTGLDAFPTPAFPSAEVLGKTDVIDLTAKMRPDGLLDWTPPSGEWTVLRLGYSLIGTANHPATKESTGLEVDKLNSVYVKRYMEHYLDSYATTVGPEMIGKRGIQNVVTDSWEAGAQNWTDNILVEFSKRRGYDPHPWLPVLAGQVVESGQSSDKFLWDFRKTLADLVADEHYGQVEASIKARGMLHYGESHEDGRTIIADGMELKKLDDVPMGAMWVHKPGDNKPLYNYDADDRESSSVAHIYGQNIAAAESLTSCDMTTPYSWSPATLKPTVDQEFLNGINRVVIHESAHQAVVGKLPGISLGPCGQWFNRNETWAEQAGVWMKYIARSSWLLQQGKNVADIAYFYGEDSNLTAIFHTSAPSVPVGYNFDYVNADAVIHALSLTNGTIMTPGGVSYRVLYLDKNSRYMSLPVLRALHTLVAQGATVAGDRPIGTPSLADDPAQFAKLVDELFKNGDGVIHYGKGKVYAGKSALEALNGDQVERDLNVSEIANDGTVAFTHRKLVGGDIYFVSNRTDRDVALNGSFRVAGMKPELWRADTGKTVTPSFRIASGRTTIPLQLEPWGAVFVVFRNATARKSYEAPQSVETKLSSVEGDWDVAFQAVRGAPATAHFDRLVSWTDSPDPGIKYFSGEGTYTKSIDADPAWFGKGSRLWIDLGEVRNLAVVTVNGKTLGTVWHAPYRIDVTSALKPGPNRLSIRVFNPWVNRLIGDAQPEEKFKYTFTTWKSYNPKSPLVPSGLIGPVTVSKIVTQ